MPLFWPWAPSFQEYRWLYQRERPPPCKIHWNTSWELEKKLEKLESDKKNMKSNRPNHLQEFISQHLCANTIRKMKLFLQYSRHYRPHLISNLSQIKDAHFWITYLLILLHKVSVVLTTVCHLKVSGTYGTTLQFTCIM